MTNNGDPIMSTVVPGTQWELGNDGKLSYRAKKSMKAWACPVACLLHMVAVTHTHTYTRTHTHARMPTRTHCFYELRLDPPYHSK